ncbi:thiamine-phosphate kinase [Agrococcus sp. SGAir0287]|uniref:thiamine-phosphate kinase n=1 Tax=Agrococcus sp. SGAir0287 TaxID=2070347 RepID=UPI0010CD489E|nr:thiamine-phosphate kinase [Agrococcus sp. SGAir0287]QCR19768.1 thiamine-phosphate kinase [Agrococcus sp. SGAir0287]
MPTTDARAPQADAAATVASVGERGALARIIPRLPRGDDTLVGPGDDAAVVRADGSFVVTTDTMLEGPDFRAAWSTWADLGAKAAATNLADVAAMGARPTALVVALAVPGATLVADLEAFADALAAAVASLAPGCGVVGGDLTTSDRTVIAVTAFGTLDGRDPVLRSGARVGDRVVVAGELGSAGEGIALLFAQAIVDGVESSAEAARLRAEHPRAVEAQLAPAPPVAMGPVLAAAGATAMLDVSDALALDASRIADASSVRIALRSAPLSAFPAPLEHVLHGGEDHALLATLPASAPMPDGVVEIGVVEPGAGVTLDGEPLAARGWDPFAG